ncbi:MAG: type 4a pilus biogenesis protein PilO [Nitrospira sp.]|nr:type 4a pilus biogenesis protein PilO [Nitrospira sp.]
MKERLIVVLRHPFAPLLPWMSVVVSLLVIVFVVRDVGLAGLLSIRDRLEKDWIATRQSLLQHREARKAHKDLTEVWALLPDERDFAPLALGISEEAKRDRVTMPALSYRTEPTFVANTSKGLLQGPMSGRYEDLRRFIHTLETADELLFIEDLELSRSGSAQDDILTFNVKIATYLRTDPERPILSDVRQ